MPDQPEFRFPDDNKQYPFVNTGMDIFEPFYLEDLSTMISQPTIP